MSREVLTSEDLALEEYCGCRWAPPQKEKCLDCDGSGFRLTRLGEAMVKFLQDRGVTLKKRKKESY
jgi:hypothetical protein